MCALTGCTKTSPIITPIKDVGCAIESAVTGSISQVVATSLNCTNQAAVQASLQSAFGNANLCATASMAKQASLKSDRPKGVIGDLACPVAVSAAMGFLSNQVPTTWGCSVGATASALSAALVAACEAAIPL